MLQADVDLVADALVEGRVRVTVDAVRAALKERELGQAGNAPGGSNSDILRLWSNWKRRRAYKVHFALFDLPEEVEKQLEQVHPFPIQFGIPTKAETCESSAAKQRRAGWHVPIVRICAIG